MAQFEIYFFGLISHISTDISHPERKQVARLIDDQPTHTPMVLTEVGWHPVFKTMDTSLGRGDATVDASFQFVPPLRAATRHTDHTPAALTNRGAVADFFYPPNARLMVAALYGSLGMVAFPQEAAIYGPACVGQMEVAVVDVDAPNLDVNFGNSVTVSSSSFMLIFNGSHPGASHFELHKKITDADEIAPMTQVMSGTNPPKPVACTPQLKLPMFTHLRAALNAVGYALTQRDIHPHDATQVDCSSSQWP